jgi:hypothetical protein
MLLHTTLMIRLALILVICIPSFESVVNNVVIVALRTI